MAARINRLMGLTIEFSGRRRRSAGILGSTLLLEVLNCAVGEEDLLERKDHFGVFRFSIA